MNGSEHSLVPLEFVEGYFCQAEWCQRCGAVVQGPLGGEREGGVPLYDLWLMVGSAVPVKVVDRNNPPCCKAKELETKP